MITARAITVTATTDTKTYDGAAASPDICRGGDEAANTRSRKD